MEVIGFPENAINLGFSKFIKCSRVLRLEKGWKTLIVWTLYLCDSQQGERLIMKSKCGKKGPTIMKIYVKKAFESFIFCGNSKNCKSLDLILMLGLKDLLVLCASPSLLSFFCKINNKSSDNFCSTSVRVKPIQNLLTV